jgi:hypothetical protein
LRQWYIRYYPAVFRAAPLSAFDQGCIIHGLTHELYHLCNVMPWFYASGQSWRKLRFSEISTRHDPDDTWTALSMWGEGTAELAAVVHSLHAIINDKDDELVASGFGAQAKPGALRRYVCSDLGYTLAALERNGTIVSASVGRLGLPIDIPLDLRRSIHRYAHSFAASPMPRYRLNLLYCLGLHRCAQIVSRGVMSPSQLLQTPLTNRQLKRLAETT